MEDGVKLATNELISWKNTLSPHVRAEQEGAVSMKELQTPELSGLNPTRLRISATTLVITKLSAFNLNQRVIFLYFVIYYGYLYFSDSWEQINQGKSH